MVTASSHLQYRQRSAMSGGGIRTLAARVVALAALVALAAAGGLGAGCVAGERGTGIAPATATPTAVAPPIGQAPAPELIAVVTGNAGEVLLEWHLDPAPAGLTGWQYRYQVMIPYEAENKPDAGAWGRWTTVPGGASARSHRVTGLAPRYHYFEVRAVAGSRTGTVAATVRGAPAYMGADGIPETGAARIIEGGRTWRIPPGSTVIDVPAGTRLVAHSIAGGGISAVRLSDTESGSELYVATDFGAECERSISPSASGRDVGALFDRIIASARVQLDAEPWLLVTAPGDRGVVDLRWFGAPEGVTRWEYRLRGPYPLEGPWRDGPSGEWTEIAGSDSDTRSHRVRELPDGTAWGFQVRAVAGSVAGAPSREVLGAPAVVGSDGLPQLLGYRAGGGRTWRLGDSPTVIDVPAGLEVRRRVEEAYGGDAFVVSSAAASSWIVVNTATGTELDSGSDGLVPEILCGFDNPRPWRQLVELFDEMRASIRLQPATAAAPPIGLAAEAVAVTAPPPAYSYSTYDTTGAVTAPGSYAFFGGSDGVPGASSVLTTYEELRRRAAVLRIHASDAGGVSRAAAYGAVTAGHLIEWRKADDCFVRYRVTAAPAATAAYREFGVRPETYVFQGCQTGSLTASAAATFAAAEEMALAHLGGVRLSSSYAVVHGAWELYSSPSVARETDTLVPEGDPPHVPARFASTGTITTVADARKFPYWREPALPAGWRFHRLYVGGGGDIPPGYEAIFVNAAGDPILDIRGEHVVGRPIPWEAALLTNVGERIVRGPRTVASRPAVVMYSPDGLRQAELFGARVDIYDAATETIYIVIGAASLGGGPVGLERVLAIARSLFEGTNPR